MITQTVTVKEKGDQNIIIGRRGTYETEQIVFDVTYLVETFGDGVAMLMVKRPSDTYAYPATVTREDNNVIWTVSEVDTGVKGHGECELFWYVNDATGLAKSVIYSVAILRDIAETYTDPPEAWETWIDEMSQLSAETMAYAEEAVDAAGDALEAKADAVDAKDAAVIAQGAAETAAENAQSAVAHYPKIEGGYWYVWTNGTWVNTGVKAEGVDGKGITSVVGAKTSTSGLVDTYTMTVTYTDNTHDTITFTVTNGRDGTDGTDGVDGVSPEVTITAITGGHTVTITDADHPSGQSFDVMDGEVTNAVLNAVLQTKAPIIKDTATGSIVTFPDGTPGPLKIEATLAPIQDLHGQDAPYPPGGGKNKFNGADVSTTHTSNWGVTWDEATATLTIEHKTEYTVGTPTFPLNLPSGTYVASYQSVSDTGHISLYVNGSWVKSLNNGVTFEIDSTKTNEVRAAAVTVTKFQIESGSTASTFAPYSNICPISGHTGAEVYVDGKNLLQPLTKYNSTNMLSQSVTLPEGTYTFSFSADVVGSGVYIRKGSEINSPVILQQYNTKQITFTLTETTEVCASILFSGGVDNANATDFQLELGSTASAYEPYSGTSVSLTFGTTVYGGKLTVNEDGTGTVVATWADHAITGDETYSTFANNKAIVLNARLPKAAKETGRVISNVFKGVSSNFSIGLGEVCIYSSNGNILFGVDTSVITNLTEWTAFAISNNLHIVYEIAEPITITLSPGTLEALYANNCVWVSDSSGDITVQYPCDTKLYIDKKIALALSA